MGRGLLQKPRGRKEVKSFVWQVFSECPWWLSARYAVVNQNKMHTALALQKLTVWGSTRSLFNLTVALEGSVV